MISLGSTWAQVEINFPVGYTTQPDILYFTTLEKRFQKSSAHVCLPFSLSVYYLPAILYFTTLENNDICDLVDFVFYRVRR
jgi:hypothetical protein